MEAFNVDAVSAFRVFGWIDGAIVGFFSLFMVL
jgi:hypothetical protein